MKIKKNIVFIGLLACGFATTAFATTTVSFYAKDQHGSIAAATDGNGNLTSASLNQYNDYGVNQSNSNTLGQVSIAYDPYQYSGEYTDQESGLQPLGNGYRYYDPSLMRFISPDSYPLLNLYAYGSGNPIGNVDPTGHLSTSAKVGDAFSAIAYGALAITMGSGIFFTGGLDVGTAAMGLLWVEGILGTVVGADPKMPLQAQDRMNMAIDGIDIAANSLDAGFAIYGEFALAKSSAEKAALLGFRVANDALSDTSSAMQFAGTKKGNANLVNDGIYIDMVGQVFGALNTFGRASDEIKPVPTEGTVSPVAQQNPGERGGAASTTEDSQEKQLALGEGGEASSENNEQTSSNNAEDSAVERRTTTAPAAPPRQSYVGSVRKVFVFRGMQAMFRLTDILSDALDLTNSNQPNESASF